MVVCVIIIDFSNATHAHAYHTHLSVLSLSPSLFKVPSVHTGIGK